MTELNAGGRKLTVSEGCWKQGWHVRNVTKAKGGNVEGGNMVW